MNYINESNRALRLDPQADLPLHLQLAEQLTYGIETGGWEAGSRLPTVRDLAADLGINYNTVRRVYRELERQGYVVTHQGRGTFVTAASSAGRRPDALRDLLDETFLQARQLGIGPDVLARAVNVRSRLGASEPPHVRLLLVECNEPDLRHFASTIEWAVGVAPTAVLLDELRERGETFADACTVVATTLWHAAEVQDLLGPGPTVVALPATPSYEEVVAPLSLLPPAAPVGLVCLTETRARGMERMLAGIGLDHLQYLPVGLDRPEAVAAVFDRTEGVYVSRQGLAARERDWLHGEQIHPYVTDLAPAGLRALRRALRLGA